VAVDEDGRPTPAAEPQNAAITEAVATARGHAETTELVLPGATTPAGKLFGGELMRLLDVISFIAATREARAPLVTARSERTAFHAPVEIGEALTLSAVVARVRGRWVEVEVDATAENSVAGEARHCTHASFLFAAPRPRA
jgi:acyl-CoA hydrolase